MRDTHGPPAGDRGFYHLTDVQYRLVVEVDDTDPRGNVCGCEEPDCTAEKEVLARLEQEDIWAWACVQVTASLEVGKCEFEGRSMWVGGCTYANEKDFVKNGGSYEELCDEALVDLLESLRKLHERGVAAHQTLQELEKDLEEQAKLRFPDVSNLDNPEGDSNDGTR